MQILMESNEYQPPIERIIFYCDENDYPIEKSNKNFTKACIVDLYTDDMEFVTIDYYKNGKYPSFTKIIRKAHILHIDIVWDR